MFFQKLARFFSTDIGIDLGTANCLVYVKDQGIVLNEPSMVAINTVTKKPIAFGKEAKEMLGRNSVNMSVIRPMKAGVIADREITELMVRTLINKARSMIPLRRRLVKPRVLIAVPTGITGVETGAVQDSAANAGASEVFLIEEPMAAAIGVGLPVAEATGSMIVDIGGGTTEVAILSLSGVVDEPRSVRVGGDEMDHVIINHIKNVHNLIIGPRTAEKIKIEIGSAYPPEEITKMTVKGRDLISTLPKEITIDSKEIYNCLQPPVTSIVEAVHGAFDHCPPEIAGDLMERGIMLAGGGSQLRGLDKLISQQMSLPVFVAENPLLAVVNGTGVVLQDMDAMYGSDGGRY